MVSVTKRAGANTVGINNAIKEVLSTLEEDTDGALSYQIFSDDSKSITFCSKLPELAGIAPYCLLAGHQHPGNGFMFFEKYPCILLNSTLKTSLLGIEPKVCIAHGMNSAAPSVVALLIDKDDYIAFYKAIADEGGTALQ